MPNLLRTRFSRLTPFLLRVLLPALFIGIALWIQISDPAFRARIRVNAFDQLQTIAPRVYDKTLPVRVIAIDDESLGKLGQWPWSRTVLAQMIDQLTAMGAAVVALDLIFPEADRTSPEQLAVNFADQPALQAQLQHMPAHDRVLANSFAHSTVALGFPIETVAKSPALPPEKARFLSFGGDHREWLPHYDGGLASLPILTDAAKGSGSISLALSSDGVLRAIPLLYQVKDRLYPGLGLEALRLFAGKENLSIHVTAKNAFAKTPGIVGVDLGNDVFVPTMEDGRAWLHFRPLAPERYISASTLLSGQVNPNQIKDHIVFIGATSKGLGDTAFSPLGELIPGVEGHVQLVEQVLAGHSLLRPAWEKEWLGTTLLLGALLLGWMLARFRPIWSVLVTSVLVAGLFAFSIWLFTQQHLLLDPFYPALAMIGLFLTLVLPRYLQTESEQRWIRNAFSRYVSPNRVKFLQDNPQQLELNTAYRECSFVMSDLAGFTSLMEKYPPEQLSELINEYLEGMIQIVFQHDGTLDRIVGDAVAVMFSAPLTQVDHAARALSCALAMDRFGQECSSRQQALGIPFGKTRVGVNTGQVLVGNFGGKTMLDYRALGDPINTAARLESINKQLGTRVCVSGATVAQCPHFIGRPAGNLVLKGKSEAIATFEPLTAEQAALPHIIDYLAAYALMDARAPEAAAVFQQLTRQYPDDPLAAYHAKRLAAGEVGSTVVMKDK
ncbi:MAG: adenylate/guanylate cyclase domain-containing protein [Gallionella sp.]|nr:adenylate/guanylate cyclase domain-containing protein [Gallionella sp.]